MIVHVFYHVRNVNLNIFRHLRCSDPDKLWAMAYRLWNTRIHPTSGMSYDQFVDHFSQEYITDSVVLLRRHLTAVPIANARPPRRVIDPKAEVPDTYSHVFTPETALD